MRLRPGHPILTYDEFNLQVGLDTHPRVLVPNTAQVRDFLTSLQAGDPVEVDDLTGPVLETLRCADLIVQVPGGTAMQAAYGDRSLAILLRRERTTVGIDAPDPLRAALANQLADAGVRVGEDAAVWIVADHRPVGRRRVDPLMRKSKPHLLVTGLPRGWVVGPFVIPGATACVRCVDLHLAGGDPLFPYLLEQSSHAESIVDPDPPLQAMVVAWAAREVLTFIDGDRPSTAASTFTLGRRGAPVTNDWDLHPDCGCSWDLGAVARA